MNLFISQMVKRWENKGGELKKKKRNAVKMLRRYKESEREKRKRRVKRRKEGEKKEMEKWMNRRWSEGANKEVG